MRNRILPISVLTFEQRDDYSYHDPQANRLIEFLRSKAETCSLDDCLRDIYRYPTFYGLEYVAEGVRVIKGETIVEGELADNGEMDFISPEDAARFPRTILEEGDLVMSVRGTVGKAAIVPSEFAGSIINANLIRMQLKDTIDPYYLHAYLTSRIGRTLIERQTTKAIQSTITVPYIKAIPIWSPSKDKQQHIAQIMQKAYADRKLLLHDAQTKIQQSGDVFLHRLGLVKQDFSDRKRLLVTRTELDKSGRDDVGFRDPKLQAIVSSLLQQFKGEVVTLGKIASVTSGSTPLGSAYVTNGVDFLRVQNIKDTGIIDLSNPLQVTEEFARTIQRAELAKGDILLSIAGTIGKVGAVTELLNRTVVNQAISRIRLLRDDVLPHYLEAALRSPLCQAQMAMLKRPVLQGNLNHRESASIQIPLVDLREQQSICNDVNRFREEALITEAKAMGIVRMAQDEVQDIILGEDFTMDDRPDGL